MTLSYILKFQGKPMHFMEKITKGLYRDKPIDEHVRDAIFHPDFDYDILDNAFPKIHTIRDDKADRWKVGNKIHQVIHNRSPKRFQFAPVLEVLAIQKIKIQYRKDGDTLLANVVVDGKHIGTATWKNCQLVEHNPNLDILAHNDGFDDVSQFFEYFSDSYKGKIIHWTNFKY